MKAFFGRWRITNMELWDQSVIANSDLQRKMQEDCGSISGPHFYREVLRANVA